MGSCDNGSVIVDGTATEVEAGLVAERHLVGELALGCCFATHDPFVDNLVELGPEMKKEQLLSENHGAIQAILPFYLDK